MSSEHPRHSELNRLARAKRDLWALAGDLADAGEPEHSKLANLVHYAWQEAYERLEREQAGIQAPAPTREELFSNG